MYAAAVDRETIGYITPPDTAVPVGTATLVVFFGAVLLIASGFIAAATSRGTPAP